MQEVLGFIWGSWAWILTMAAIVAVVFWPLVHVLRSERIDGWERLGWLLLVLAFSWLGYAVFLVATSRRPTWTEEYERVKRAAESSTPAPGTAYPPRSPRP